ncbi:unnamed protein product [Withania somnifera]
MGHSTMRLFATFFLVAMLLLATEMRPMSSGEARTCESQSQSFKGTCLSDTNCTTVCHTEGFIGGDCHVLCRHCFCISNNCN